MVVPLCSRVAVSETPQPPLDRKYVLFGSSNLHLFFLLFLGSLLAAPPRASPLALL
jgi:hypothetical protein